MAIGAIRFIREIKVIRVIRVTGCYIKAMGNIRVIRVIWNNMIFGYTI